MRLKLSPEATEHRGLVRGLISRIGLVSSIDRGLGSSEAEIVA